MPFQPAERNFAEEFIERFAVAAYGIENGIGGTDQKDLGMFYQCLTQGMDFPFITQLPEHKIEIFHKQDQPLFLYLAEFQKRRQGVGRQAFSVALVLL